MKNKKLVIFLVLIIALVCTCFVACDKTNDDVNAGNDADTNIDDTVVVQFDSNGGVGTIESLQLNKAGSIALSKNTFTKANYSFLGWSTSADGQVVYEDEETISVTQSIKLFAVWNKINSNYELEYYFRSSNTDTYVINSEFSRTELGVIGSQVSVEQKSFPGYDNDDSIVSGTITNDDSLKLKYYYTKNDKTINVTQFENEQEVIISWSDFSKDITKVSITVYHGNVSLGTTIIDNENTLCQGKAKVYAYYGKQKAVVTVYGKDASTYTTYSKDVAVTNTAYNIGYFNGTFPVSMFTLMLMDEDSTTINHTDPTFMFLSRGGAYNWSALPENTYAIPMADSSMTGYTDFDGFAITTALWIKELYELDNTSTFNLYLTDNYVGLILQFFVDNNIPLDKWSATMFSDGTGTANWLRVAFNNDDPTTKYNEMASAWNNYVANASTTGYDKTAIANLDYRCFSYVACTEMTNVKWYTGRLRTTENVILKDAEFAATIVDGSKSNGRSEYYLNNLLDALTVEEKDNFKKLYSIDESTFEVATSANKKVMMILGTKYTTESSNLEDYIRMTVATFGDDYIYYYKPHPGYPTDSCEERQLIFNNLAESGINIIELEASIAAEFFLFFFDDIEMIGYSSTTFASGTDENAVGVYGQPTTYYPDLLEVYFNKISDITTISSKYGITLEADKQYYLAEFTDTMASDKDIAIYDVSEKTMKTYKKVLVSGSSDVYEYVLV